MKEFSDHTLHPLGCQRHQGPIIYGLCTRLSRLTTKENEQFSFIQTGPVMLIAPDSALVGFRPCTAAKPLPGKTVSRYGSWSSRPPHESSKRSPLTRGIRPSQER